MASRKALAERLGLKVGMDVRVLQAPPDVATLLAPLPVDSHVLQRADRPSHVVVLFARTSNELVRGLPLACSALALGGRLWVAFYKGTSGKATDINRDIVGEHALSCGLETVAIVSIDAQWSALRLKQM